MGGSKPQKVRTTKAGQLGADILEQREDFYKEFTLPILRQHIEETSAPGAVAALATQGVAGVNQSFDQAKTGLLSDLARRGIDEGGATAMGLSNLSAARSQGVSNVLQNAQTVQNQQRFQNLGLLSNLAPRPGVPVIGQQVK